MIAHKIHHFFIEQGTTLSLAESCTGGALSSKLVLIPGCSSYFLGSVVSYSRASKEKFLGVDGQIITTYGEVSSQTAEAMAKGALREFSSDVALAITGIAGPDGGSLEKPVGTVFFAVVAQKKSVLSWQGHFKGDREEVIAQTVDAALSYLWHFVSI